MRMILTISTGPFWQRLVQDGLEAVLQMKRRCFYIPRGSLLRNVKNLAIDEPKLSKKQDLDAEKLQKQFDARARPLPKPLTPTEKMNFTKSKNQCAYRISAPIRRTFGETP
jgi:hypothetical protein